MLSSSLLPKALLAGATLASVMLLGACSGITPVYGERGLTDRRLELAYSEPASRLDQIVIQELSAKLGRARDQAAPLVTITTAASSRALAQTGVTKPRTEHEAEVSVSYTLVAGSRILASGTRRATAGYQTVGQVFADDSAYQDALDRAAKAAAETVRLSLLAELARPARSSFEAP